jgi:hypothetical protein
MIVPDEDFHHIALAKVAKQLLEVGGHIQVGGHGQMHGIGSHWETWMFQQGGMTEMQALRVAKDHNI